MVKKRGKRLGFVLSPGASATRDHSTLLALDEAWSAQGHTVVRLDLPKRVEAAAVAIAAAADDLRPSVDGVVLGGRSYGGRASSMAVADGCRAAGLVLISYPLHPPGKPEQLRTAHLPAIAVPVLFVSGTRDTFGTPAELEAAGRLVAGPVDHVWLEGGDHGLRRRDPDVVAAAVGWSDSLKI